MMKNGVELKKALKEEYITPVSVYDGKYTKTTQFMLPSIGVNVKNRLIFSFFVNAYVEDQGHKHQYERPIFVLFAVKDFESRDWSKVYTTLVKSPNYIMDYDCGVQDDKYLVMLVFSVPEEFENDYYCFKRGRYSLFSEKYRAKFPKFVSNEAGEAQTSIIWQIINKDVELKRDLEIEFGLPEFDLDKPDPDGKIPLEIWDKPRKDREYYRYEKVVS